MIRRTLGLLLALLLLAGMARAAGLSLQHVKAHGALYNMASKDETLAQALAEAVKEIDPELILLAPAGSCIISL